MFVLQRLSVVESVSAGVCGGRLWDRIRCWLLREKRFFRSHLTQLENGQWWVPDEFLNEIILVRCLGSWKCVCVLGRGGSLVADLISGRLSHRYRRWVSRRQFLHHGLPSKSAWCSTTHPVWSWFWHVSREVWDSQFCISKSKGDRQQFFLVVFDVALFVVAFRSLRLCEQHTSHVTFSRWYTFNETHMRGSRLKS